MVDVLLEYIDYYSSIILDACYLVCSKLCWHNWLVPSGGGGWTARGRLTFEFHWDTSSNAVPSTSNKNRHSSQDRHIG